MSHEGVAARRREFDAHIWDHTADVFQTAFDTRRPLAADELQLLDAVAKGIDAGADDQELADVLRNALRSTPEMIHVVMQAAGLTRNKIIVDLKAAIAARGTPIPGKPPGLVRSAAWEYAGPYLAFKIRKTLSAIAALPEESRLAAYEAINQATYPGWIRQERAKRQGHEAEGRVAVLLFSLGLPFVPVEKAENPMCRDAQIDGISYDLVVPDLRQPRLVMKSTVQTANIGQFGESKADLEVTEAKAALTSRFRQRPPCLLALVDGVGFRSNIAGLHGVLDNADEFAQFATVWKIAVIAASSLGQALTVALPPGHEREHEPFLGRWSGPQVVQLNDGFRAKYDPADLVAGGEAILIAG